MMHRVLSRSLIYAGWGTPISSLQFAALSTPTCCNRQKAQPTGSSTEWPRQQQHWPCQVKCHSVSSRTPQPQNSVAEVREVSSVGRQVTVGVSIICLLAWCHAYPAPPALPICAVSVQDPHPVDPWASGSHSIHDSRFVCKAFVCGPLGLCLCLGLSFLESQSWPCCWV